MTDSDLEAQDGYAQTSEGEQLGEQASEGQLGEGGEPVSEAQGGESGESGIQLGEGEQGGELQAGEGGEQGGEVQAGESGEQGGEVQAGEGGEQGGEVGIQLAEGEVQGGESGEVGIQLGEGGEAQPGVRGDAWSPDEIAQDGVGNATSSRFVDGAPQVRVEGLPHPIDLEEYLRGVVPSEMSAWWNPQALRVQAVCARTYALYHLMRGTKHAGKGYDVCRTVCCQVYKPQRIHANTDAAIRATRGQVIVHVGTPGAPGTVPTPGGQSLIEAEFSADCAGRTRAAGGRPYFHPVDCPDKDGRGPVKQSHKRGMCQHGAQRFATDEGAREQLPEAQPDELYRRIIHHYYRDVAIVESWGC